MRTSLIRKFPATLLLIILNTAVFFYCLYINKSFNEPGWTTALLDSGAIFAPYALDKEYYRIFTYIFLHGGVLHLLFNMYALLVIGQTLESRVGTKKFLWVYFLSGIFAAFASLNYNLFIIGVGASGAIFGLFGFTFVIQLSDFIKSKQPFVYVLVNFGIFFFINLILSETINADVPAHIGGMVCGIFLGVLALLGSSVKEIKAEYILALSCVLVFYVMPRHQVTYFNFFQQVLAAEDSLNNLHKKRDLRNDDYVREFKKLKNQWEGTVGLLNELTYLPEPLHSDTIYIRKYIKLQQLSLDYRIRMIERETFRYMDSIEWAQQQIQQYMQLNFPLNIKPRDNPPDQEQQNILPPPIMVWYDENWKELERSTGTYYRIGSRDSLGRWQGPVRDFYKNGDVQMKGVYREDKKDGVFIYYSASNTYSALGRYEMNEHVGKWEYFHNNGKLFKEEYFNQDYFVKNIWDSLGNQQVKDGAGTYYSYHTNGIVAESGDYKYGKKSGYWYGLHPEETLYFEEVYDDGVLIRGRSKLKDGSVYLYDHSSLFPIPKGGNEELMKYLGREMRKINRDIHGIVQIFFRVNVEGDPTDFEVIKSLSPELDQVAIKLIENGPRWEPGRLYGHVYRDAWTSVFIEF